MTRPPPYRFTGRTAVPTARPGSHLVNVSSLYGLIAATNRARSAGG